MTDEIVPDDTLLPSETTVLETLASSDVHWTQRELAHKTGYSIGLINTILKKLSRTGYIKVANITKHRLQYLLTPRGLAATSKTAYKYIIRTFQDYQRLYFQISLFFKELSIQGKRDLYVRCDDVELNSLVQVVMRESAQDSGIRFHEVPLGGVTTVCLKGAMVTPSGPVLNLSMQVEEGRPS